MDWLKWGSRLPDLFRKYKYVILVLVIGIVLMLIPGREAKEESAAQEVVYQPAEESIDQRLTRILSKIRVPVRWR